VLVLDDPLSALDINTEAQVEKALRSVLAGTTALVVAHRASTVQLADRVALLVDGRIAAVGTHSELMASTPAYQDLLASRADVSSASRGSAGESRASSVGSQPPTLDAASADRPNPDQPSPAASTPGRPNPVQEVSS
jgi:ABC-type sulfate/molybdate transport systems ATPase subunit